MSAPTKQTCRMCKGTFDASQFVPRERICRPCKNADQRRRYAKRMEGRDYDDECYKPLPCEIAAECELIRAAWSDEIERSRRVSGDYVVPSAKF